MQQWHNGSFLKIYIHGDFMYSYGTKFMNMLL